MFHRHLDHQEFTLAAIDNVIARGGRSDWLELRQVVKTNVALSDKVERVCTAHIGDPYAQRHHFWMNYVKKYRATS